MRHIPLRIVTSEGADALSYADAIRLVIRQPLDKQKGVDIDEMRQGIRIFDRLDAAGDVLELEDADYQHLVAKVKAMSWGIVDRNLMEFIDTVLGAPEASLNGQLAREVAASS